MVWYSHVFQNFPQFNVIHTVKDFGIVNKAEIDVFLELSCFSNDPTDVGNLISGSSAFSKTSFCWGPAPVDPRNSKVGMALAFLEKYIFNYRYIERLETDSVVGDSVEKEAE